MNNTFYYYDSSDAIQGTKKYILPAIIVIVLIGLPTFTLQVGFYVLCGMLLVMALLDVTNSIRIDPFQLFLGFFLFFSVFLSLINQSESLSFPVNLAESLLLVLLVSVYRTSGKHAVNATILALIIFYFQFGIDKIFVYKHSISMVGMMFSLYCIIAGKKYYGIVLLLLSIPISTRTVWIAYVSGLGLWVFRCYIPTKILRFIPVMLVISILSVVLFIGHYYATDTKMIDLTTTRSIYYGIGVHDIVNRGLDIFFPVNNGHLSSLLVGLESFVSPDNRFYNYLSSLGNQCPHCTYLEWLDDYGIFFLVSFIFITFKMTNQKNVFFVVFFLIIISFQCGAMKPAVLFPFYIVYHLAGNFIELSEPYSDLKNRLMRR